MVIVPFVHMSVTGKAIRCNYLVRSCRRLKLRNSSSVEAALLINAKHSHCKTK